MSASLRRYVLFLAAEKGLSKNSIDAQKNDLRIFYVFIKRRQGGIFEMQKASVVIDLIQRERERGKKPSSLNRLLSSIKGYVNYCLGEYKLSFSPILKIESLKTSKHLPIYLKEEEIKKLISAKKIETTEDDRDNLIIETLYALGIRVSELCGLRRSDIDEKSHLIKVTGKGQKQRHLPLYDELLEKIKRYAQKNEIKDEDKIFDVSRQKVWQMIRQRGLDAGIKGNLHPHLFRHSFASHMIQRGAKIREVQELLGHADIQTTEIYAHLDKSYLKNILNEKHTL